LNNIYATSSNFIIILHKTTLCFTRNSYISLLATSRKNADRIFMKTFAYMLFLDKEVHIKLWKWSGLRG